MNPSREWLKQFRLKRNLNHKDIARTASIHRAYYTMIENGQRTPSVSVAKKIAAVLGFHWSRFFEDPPEDRAVNL